jgi:hypothetical protein
VQSKTTNTQRLRAGDAVALERENGDWMKGVVVLVEDDGIDVVVDGEILAGEVFSVSCAVRNDARYSAVMEVVDAGPGRSRVRLVEDWERVQMRESVRVAVLGLHMDVQGNRAGRASQPVDARLLDLSAGGLRFESTASFARGDVVEIRFHLAQAGPVRIRGEILRAAGRRSEDSGSCQYGVRFCGFDEATRVKIMTWVFAEQARRFRDPNKPETPA